MYSLLFIGTAIASLIGLLVANLLLPLFGWRVVFMIFAGLNALSLLLLLVFENGQGGAPLSDERPLFSQGSKRR